MIKPHFTVNQAASASRLTLTSEATAGHSAKYTRSEKASKAKLPPVLYGLAALLVCLFATVDATKAQSVTANSYLNELYNWWAHGATVYDSQTITVRVTFLGGSAHPSDYTGVSMAIFEGTIHGSKGDEGAFSQSILGPIAKGSGLFYNITNISSPEGPHQVPFYLYQEWGSQRLVLSLDLRGVWSNASQYQNFYFDKITSQGGFPWGNWIGLNGGVGSAQGQVTLACSVRSSILH